MEAPEHFPRLLAQQPISLKQKLDKISSVAATLSLPKILQEWGQNSLNLNGQDLEQWTRNAWWGLAAGELIRAYVLNPEFREEAFDLVEADEWADQLNTWNSSTTILATAHVGPPKFAMGAIIKRCKKLIVWTDNLNDELWNPPREGLELINPRVENRGQLFVRSALALREGHIIFGAADGKRSDQVLVVKDFNQTWTLSPGIPTLARRMKANTHLVLGLWDKQRIKLVNYNIPHPSEHLTDDQWNKEWLSSYWEIIKKIIAKSPSNLRWQYFKEPNEVFRALKF